jgi:cytochrome P450
MTKEEIIPTFAILLLAGSETTATLLSATTFYLLTNPSTLATLQFEIRTSFTREEEITQISVNKMKYLLAVLDETMRIHPPTPRGGPRVVPGKGEMVDGVWVPGGVSTFFLPLPCLPYFELWLILINVRRS